MMRIARDEVDSPRATPNRLAALVWTAILTAHATAAVAWWWLMPGGFPLSSQRFWINRVAPILVLAIALTARFFWARQRHGLLALLLFLATLWLGLALGLRAFFPITFKWLWIGPLMLGLVMTVLARRSVEQPLNQLVRLATALGISFGAWAAFTQKGLPPATIPSGGSAVIPDQLAPPTGTVKLNEQVRADPHQGTVQILSASSQLFIEPLLTFDSRSPDRCWTLLAPRELRRGPTRRALGVKLMGDIIEAGYESDFRQNLFVSAAQKPSVVIESNAELTHEIYSHLNTFVAFTLTSVKAPRISFSCLSDEKIDITHGGYPFGKPHRFASFGSDLIFRVVEASSAEKGPFHTLAEAKGSRGQSISMLLYDGDTLLYTIELKDWTSQLSTQLSPTAGWDVPENAIEFSRASEDPKSAVSIFVTLANTSVGRGFDTVGHAPGVYRNRLRVTDHQR